MKTVDGAARSAQGAMYAEDGTPLQFTLYTNEGNTRREAIGTLIQDELAQVGIKVDFQTIDFNTLLDIMDSQTFDAIILGWRNGYPDDPDATQLFTPGSDVIGSGSNFTSYNNPEFNALNDQAKTVPGCDPAERAPLYAQMQKIMQQRPALSVAVRAERYVCCWCKRRGLRSSSVEPAVERGCVVGFYSVSSLLSL